MHNAMWHSIETEAIGYLQKYLQLNTTNPPGNERAGADFLLQILHRENIHAQTFEKATDRTNLIATLSTKEPIEKPLILLSHIDVVPVNESEWEVPPFSGQIVDGYLWGRGALDMKSMGIMELMVLLLLKRFQQPLKRDIILLAVADEEQKGTFGAEWALEYLGDSLEAECVLNEGGRGLKGIIHHGDEVICTVSVAEKKVLTLSVTAHGKAGHGSQPHDNNPNEMLLQAIQRILTFAPIGSLQPVVQETITRLGRIKSTRFTEAMKRNTISVTEIHGGIAENVIPSVSRATLDCRILPNYPVEKFLQELLEIVNDPRIDIQPDVLRPDTSVSNYNSPFFKIIEHVNSEYIPHSITVPILTPVGTDSRFFRERGIDCYGYTPVVVNESELNLVHNHNERIRVSEFRRGIRMLYEIVSRFCTY